MFPFHLQDSCTPALAISTLLDEAIGQCLRRAATEARHETALVAYCAAGTREREWTYSQLLDEAELLARHLAALFPKGTPIAVCAPNIPQWVILEYAAALAGLVLVTVNPSLQTPEVNHVIGQSGAVALFHVQSCRGNPIATIAREVQRQQPSLEHLFDLQCENLVDLLPGDIALCLPQVNAGDPAQIQYTSGTTGTPKGAVLTHRGLLNNAMLTAERLGMDGDSRYLNMMPMFHTSGCGLGTLMPLAMRCCAILVEQFEPAMVNDVIARESVTCFLGVPTMLSALLEEQRATPRDHSAVRAIIAGGATVAPDLVARSIGQWGCPVQVGYGQTETSPVITQTWPGDCLEDLTATIGQPLPHTEVAILDPASNSVQPLDTVGEICARGYLLMQEYNDNPEATDAAIDAQGWLHTGDLGTMDARGYVRITGRLKDMIIRGGENLFPAEIENVVQAHPSVAEVAVIGIPDDKWGEVVGCFVRFEDGAPIPTADELARHTLDSLSPQKKPAYWFSVLDWPLTTSGKIQKFRLLEEFQAGLHRHL